MVASTGKHIQRRAQDECPVLVERRPVLCGAQAALRESDLLLTVSPNYAAEICADEGMGCGMRKLLAARGVWCAAAPHPLLCTLPACNHLHTCLQALHALQDARSAGSLRSVMGPETLAHGAAFQVAGLRNSWC